MAFTVNLKEGRICENVGGADVRWMRNNKLVITCLCLPFLKGDG